MNILLIEDDNVLRSGLSSILLDWGYTVTAASNGEEAFELLKQNNKIDFLICDIFLPVLSGPSFLLKLKHFFPAEFPKVLIISSVKDPETFLKTIDVKHNAFISKPIDFVELKNVLSKLLSA